MTKEEQLDETAIIEMIKVSKKYPPNVQALQEVSFSVKTGEMCFLTGPSGAGKTTLLKLICSMERPTTGLIEVFGKPTIDIKGARLAKLRQKIGVAYQDFKLLEDRTAAENIAISMEVSYKKPALIQQRVRKLLGQLDLTDKQNIPTGELSRGEQQRVTLARAVANSPTIILVDEPTGNLDAYTTGRVMRLLDNCNKAGATIMIATHDEAILRVGTCRIFQLSKGVFAGDNFSHSPEFEAASIDSILGHNDSTDDSFAGEE